MPSVKKPKLKPEAPPRSAVGGVLPEVVDYQHRKWTVQEGAPDVDYARQVVTVPSGDDHRFERAVTLTKVRVSPETPAWAAKVAAPKNIDACESARCQSIVRSQLGIYDESVPSPAEIEAVKNAVRKGDQQEAARLVLADPALVSHADSAYHDLWEPIYSKNEADEAAWKPLYDEAQEFSSYIGAAHRLINESDYRTSVAAAGMIDELDTIRKPGKRSVAGDAGSFEELVEQSNTEGAEGRQGSRRDQERLIRDAKEKFNEAAGGFGADGDGGDTVGAGTPFELDDSDMDPTGEPDWDSCKWGRVEWVKPPLVRNLLMRKSQRTKRPTDEGAVVRNMHRWYTDRRVFTRKKKIPGGTLLVDISGSMSLSAEQVEAIIDVSPLATIVTYSGNGGRGRMTLVAKAGRRAEDEQIYSTMGGNEIDGPALKWLAQQAEPRVWVSDGLACTAGAYNQDDCRAWCRTFAKKNRIVRMPSADKALELLRRLW